MATFLISFEVHMNILLIDKVKYLVLIKSSYNDELKVHCMLVAHLTLVGIRANIDEI